MYNPRFIDHVLYALMGCLVAYYGATWLIEKEMGHRCDEHEIVVKAYNFCVDTPGCFFDASHTLKAARSHEYREAKCNNERQAIQIIEKDSRFKETNPSDGVGPETRTERRRDDNNLFSQKK